MPAWGLVLIALGAVLVIGAVTWALVDRRRSGRLRKRFGPEYDRTLRDADSRREAESELAERERRRQALEIRPLSSVARHRYLSEWKATQARFVDAPEDAVREADVLVTEVMRERRYPMDDFDQRAADISVDHPHVVGNYRSAHAVSGRIEKAEVTTEDLRAAMVNYRALFEELLAAEDREDVRNVG
ncbi:MAG: hypothetical protein ABR518_08285 [Actinomycetota bacterium]